MKGWNFNMAIDNQQVIVEVVADASKAVQGLNEVFETARRHSKDGSGLENIQADIEKLQSQSIETSKAVEVMRTALKGIGNSEDINTLNTQMADMEKNISAVSKALETINNVSSIEAVNKAMDKVDTKMKGLDTTLSSVKLMVKGVFTPMEEQTKEVSAEVETLTKRIDGLKKVKDTIKSSSKEASIKVDVNIIKKAYGELKQCTNEAKNLREALASTSDNTQKDNLSKQLNTKIEAQKNAALKMVQLENAVQTGVNSKLNKQNVLADYGDMFKNAHTFLNNFTKNIDDSIANTEAKIKEATGEIKAQVSSFDVKEGKISVPVEMTESSAQIGRAHV